MILHGFAWRSSKNLKIRPELKKIPQQPKKYRLNFIAGKSNFLITPDDCNVAATDSELLGVTAENVL